MGRNLTFNRLAPRSALMRFWQTKDKSARLDASGLTATVVSTTLPFMPTVTAVNAAQGEFRIEAPTSAQLDLCAIERAYVIDVSLINGADQRIEGCSIWVKVA